MTSAPRAFRPDPWIARDLLARAMWILHRMDLGEDGFDAAQRWDDDALLTDVYEHFEGVALQSISAEMERRRHD